MTTKACPRHSGLAEKVEGVADDVREIKADVKALVTARRARAAF